MKKTGELLKELKDKSVFATIWAFFWRYLVMVLGIYIAFMLLMVIGMGIAML